MFIRLQNNTVVERFVTLPVFTPELMATIVPADDGMQEGWITADGGKTFAPPPPPPAPVAVPNPIADLAAALVTKGVLAVADLPASVKALPGAVLSAGEATIG